MTDIAHPIPQIKPNLRASLASVWKARNLSQRSLDLLVRGVEYAAATLFIYGMCAGALLYFLPFYTPGFPAGLLVGGIVFLASVYILIFGIATLRSFDNASILYRLDLIGADVERLEHNTSQDFIEQFNQNVEELQDRLERINKDCPFTDPD